MSFKLVTRGDLAYAGIVLALLVVASSPLGAIAQRTLQRQDKAVSLAQITGTLKSGTWPERDAALKLLSQVPGDQGDRLWDSLVAALDAENKFVLVGASKGNEDYSEYYGRLIDAVLLWMSPKRIDGKSASILVNAIYDGESRYARALGDMGGSRLSAAAEQCAATARAFRRAGCLNVIGWVLKADNKAELQQERLKDSERYSLLRALRMEVLGGGEELGQIAAVNALVVAEDAESLPILERAELSERGRQNRRKQLHDTLIRALRALRERYH